MTSTFSQRKQQRQRLALKLMPVAPPAPKSPEKPAISSTFTQKKELSFHELQAKHKKVVSRLGGEANKKKGGEVINKTKPSSVVSSRTPMRSKSSSSLSTPKLSSRTPTRAQSSSSLSTPKVMKRYVSNNSTPSPETGAGRSTPGSKRRERLNRKNHLLGNRGSAYAYSPSVMTPKSKARKMQLNVTPEAEKQNSNKLLRKIVPEGRSASPLVTHTKTSITASATSTKFSQRSRQMLEQRRKKQEKIDEQRKAEEEIRKQEAVFKKRMKVIEEQKRVKSQRAQKDPEPPTLTKASPSRKPRKAPTPEKAYFDDGSSEDGENCDPDKSSSQPSSGTDPSLTRKMGVLSDSTVQPLSLSRERELRATSSGDSSGASRRNLDKRTARLRYAAKFKDQLSLMKPAAKPQKPGNKVDGVSVYIRKRPIFDYEMDRNDFDVVTVNGDEVIVNSCQIQADMKHKVIKPVSFTCTGVFGADQSTKDVYDKVASPLVRLATNGKLATVLSYGQTGSGKTYTMSGIEDSVCADLFQDPQNQISVQFVELAGKLVNDLLQESQVKIADQPSGNVRLLNAKVVQVSSPEALAKAIARGKRRRSTEATDKNGVSSRSHAVCQISCVNAKKQLGILNLIDLAGSERRGDSLFHSGERQKESTEINSSLYSLKECIRARMSGKPNNVIPYRSSNLTRILRPTLETSDAQLSVIATVAPNATDSEHTIETLKTVCSLIGTLPCLEDEVEVPDAPVGRLLSPKQYSNDDIVSFMMEKKLLKEEEAKNIPDKMNGRQLMRMTIMQLKNAIYSQDADQDRAEKLFRCLRRESDRVGRLELKQRIASTKGSPPCADRFFAC